MRREEAYEIDALARQKLRDTGFNINGRIEGDYEVFLSSARPDLRVVMTSGSRKGGVLRYGDVQLQQERGGEWRTVQEITKQDFAKSAAFDIPGRNPPALGIRPPGL